LASHWEIPGPAYLDASALVRIYIREKESEKLDRSLRGRQDILVSNLGVTELSSAAARRRRDGTLPEDKAASLYKMVLADLSAGFFEKVLELQPESHRRAERLLLASSVPLRASDALHLALAMEAEASCIVTFDDRVTEAARAFGLRPAPEN